MSLASLKGMLSRAEMKNIMAGSGFGCAKSGESCDRAGNTNGVHCCAGADKCPSQEDAKCP